MRILGSRLMSRKELRDRLTENGAVKACMTGSGSAVFGLFRTAGEAEEAADRMKDVPFCAAVESV